MRRQPRPPPGTNRRQRVDHYAPNRFNNRPPQQRSELPTTHWSYRDGTGITFDSSAGFTLPNGAVRAPDASWLLLSRWQTLTPDQQAKFAPICPDFVIELRSPSDDLPIIQTKMSEYINNGARLGWLIDPQNRQVHIYRPNRPITILNAPTTISADPELPGFTLNLQTIW